MCECADRLKQSDACSLTTPQKYCSVKIYVLNPTGFLGGRIKHCGTIFIERNLVCKALYFGVGSGRGWFLNGAPEEHDSLLQKCSLPKGNELAVAGLARGKKDPGAVLFF